MTLEFIEGQIEFDDFSLLAQLIDFRSDLYSLKEDMLQISYKGNFLLDVGWYPSFDPDGCFQIRAVKEFDWENPLYFGQANSFTEAIHRIRDAQNVILAEHIPNRKYQLQPIRVPSGWTVSINNLYEVELSEETVEWYCSSVLMGGFRQGTGACFDSRLEPEGDPSGDFVVEFLTMKFDSKGKPIKNSEELVSILKTKSRDEFIRAIENYMLKN